MKIERRQIGLGLALIATLLAVALVESPETSGVDELVAPTRVALNSKSQVGGGLDEPSTFGEIQRKSLPDTDSDPFRPKSWYVAPPPPPPEPPPKPTAPPLPFQYMGLFEDQGKVVVYLTRGNESFAISAGDKFAGAYQLEKIERGILIISYLPLSIRQTLSIGNNE